MTIRPGKVVGQRTENRVHGGVGLDAAAYVGPHVDHARRGAERRRCASGTVWRRRRNGGSVAGGGRTIPRLA